MSEVDWASIAEPVVRELLGEPNPRLSCGPRWRYGTRGSLSVDVERGIYYDHEEGTGGGLLDLVQREEGCDKTRAHEWLRRRGYVPERKHSRRHRRQSRPARGRRASPPHPRSSGITPSSRMVVPIWRVSIPADLAASGYLADERWVWPGWEHGINVRLPEDVRWVSRVCAPRADPSARWPGIPAGLEGALLVGHRAPTGQLRAIAIEGLHANGTLPAERWRRSVGAASGTVFTARGASGSEVVHVAEGYLDALALVWAPWLEPRDGRIVSVGGTSGLAGLRAEDVPALVGSANMVVLHPDGDTAGQGAAAQAQAHIQAAGTLCRIRRCPRDLDPADEFAGWLREQTSVCQKERSWDRDAAVYDVWVSAVRLARSQRSV